MPIYEYRCKSCGHLSEALQSMKEANLTDCGTCHQPALERTITAARVRLKGTGYYETDEKPKEKQRHIASTGDGHSDAKPSTPKIESGKSQTSSV